MEKLRQLKRAESLLGLFNPYVDGNVGFWNQRTRVSQLTFGRLSNRRSRGSLNTSHVAVSTRVRGLQVTAPTDREGAYKPRRLVVGTLGRPGSGGEAVELVGIVGAEDVQTGMLRGMEVFQAVVVVLYTAMIDSNESLEALQCASWTGPFGIDRAFVKVTVTAMQQPPITVTHCDCRVPPRVAGKWDRQDVFRQAPEVVHCVEPEPRFASACVGLEPRAVRPQNLAIPGTFHQRRMGRCVKFVSVNMHGRIWKVSESTGVVGIEVGEQHMLDIVQESKLSELLFR
jgi:hypothetical protein